MPYTREEYISIGDQFASQHVIDQMQVMLDLATRDARILGRFGWSAAKTAGLTGIHGALTAANTAYERKFGTDVGRTRNIAVEIDLAKRWRLRAISIGENCLTDEEELATLRRAATRVGRDPEKLGAQIGSLLDVARRNEPAFRAEDAADDAFFAEGDRLVAALKTAVTTRRNRPKNLPAEHDKLDELDGRAWEMLKKLSLAGKSAHAAAGDRARVAEYNLDVLYGRPILRPPRPAPAHPPTPGTDTVTRTDR